ncbi:hypothetical protein [Planococcus shenhongbingii]|uniref:Uncharacterized protein n=1 Tax=Planococcus shenhongbingii TaxID=3058398 RepID=A0ABT8N8A6_9BACL|nr:hypothetical protein [Planococcus sp. N017]MDN7243968.1 hypothetical protein [Planococcus sp. N017]
MFKQVVVIGSLHDFVAAEIISVRKGIRFSRAMPLKPKWPRN